MVSQASRAGRLWARSARLARTGTCVGLALSAAPLSAAEPPDPRPRICWQVVDSTPIGERRDEVPSTRDPNRLAVSDGAHPVIELGLPAAGGGAGVDDRFVVTGRDPQLILRRPRSTELLWIWAHSRAEGMRRLTISIQQSVPPSCAARGSTEGPVVVVEAIAESLDASCVSWPLDAVAAEAPTGSSCFPKPVPDLIGRPLAEAEAIVSEFELVVGEVVDRPDFGPSEIVLDQNPRPSTGLDLATGDAIDLVVAGQRLVRVPDLRGRSVAMATTELAALELSLEARSGGAKMELAAIPDYEIAEQSPAGGEVVPAGGSLRSEVALRLPDLRNIPLAAAVRQLRAQGLEIDTRGLDIDRGPEDEEEEVFTIALHRPAAGALATFGQRIEAEIAVAVPALGRLTPAAAERRLAERSLRLERRGPPPPDARSERIVGQVPPSGATLPPGSPVAVEVGVLAPRIESSAQDDSESAAAGSVGAALGRLAATNLSLALDAAQIERWRDDVGNHRLRAQRPRPGTLVRAGSAIGAALEVKVPNLLWLSAGAAEAGLRELGLEPARPLPRARGSLRQKVVGQSPAPGIWLETGLPVQLTLGPGLPPPPPEPDWPWLWALAVVALAASLLRQRQFRRPPAKLRVEGHTDFGTPLLEVPPAAAQAGTPAIRLRPRWDAGRQTVQLLPSTAGGSDA